MKHLTRALSLLLSLCLLGSLVACGGSWKDDVQTSALGVTITKALPVGDGWATVNDGYISSSEWGEDYQVLLDAVSDYCIQISEQSDMNIDELGVFHVTSSGDVSKVKAIVETYVSAKKLRMTSLLESYNPDELPKLDAAKVTVCGNYILYTILSASDTSAAHSAFESALKAE